MPVAVNTYSYAYHFGYYILIIISGCSWYSRYTYEKSKEHDSLIPA